MIAVGDKLVSDVLFEKKFVCDLNACKGACCVEGEYGAPLEEEEAVLLQDIHEDLLPYLSEEGKRAIDKQGQAINDPDGDLVTPLINGKECAYTNFDENGVASCAIEHAFNDGAVDFRKPISCHLYPIRVVKLKDFEALNIHDWKVCAPACECGAKLDVPLVKFLRKPLIRKYGEEWVADLDVVFDQWSKK